MPDSDLTKVVTFYSYKGGVGRSMAVLNVSALLASRGFRVLVIDFDLEAPGLSHLLVDALPKKRKGKISGVVELLCDAKTRGVKGDLFAKNFRGIASKYTFGYPIPKELKAHKDARLFIMPAGETDADYTSRLNELDLKGLYKEGLGKGLISHFKHALVSSGLYDFIIVDSRTGHSDEAGICTRDLADHLMVVSGFNRQNLAGTAAFLGNLRSELEQEGRKPKDPTIILSPVPIGEEEMLIKREAEAADLFGKAWQKRLKLDLFIPYHPRLALTEDAYVTTRTASYLRDSYQEIEMRLLTALGQMPRILLNQAKEAIISSSGPTAVSLLERYVKLRNSGSRNTSSQRSFPFSWQISLDLMEEEELLKKTLTLPESLRILELLQITERSSYRLAEFGKQLHKLEYPRASDFDRLILKSNLLKPDALGNYAVFLKNVRELPDAAESFYKRALDADPKHEPSLANYGQFLIGKGETDQGLALLHSAWRQKSKLSNTGVAELAYILWLGTQMTGKDGMPWEKTFKYLILAGFPRAKWNFDAMLKQAESKLSPALLKYAKALADAFRDETKVEALDGFDRWKKLQPMDPKLVE